MIKDKRQAFNEVFTAEKYRELQERIENRMSYRPPFRIAETPIFFTNDFRHKLEDACHRVLAFINREDFWELTDKAVPKELYKSVDRQHVHFACIDFSITEEKGELFPRLIEVQGFPSLFSYQPFLAYQFKEVYGLSSDYSCFVDTDESEYFDLLRETIIGEEEAHHCVILDIQPETQHTYIDFLFTKELFGVQPLCVSGLWAEGDQLFYDHPSLGKTQVKRIYNRFILDEFLSREDIELRFELNRKYDVTWVTAPENFYRVSKYVLPLIDEDFVPESHFLSELESYPPDLENYVLKPLFSFSGKGLIFDIKEGDLESIDDPENYILQRKVDYTPVIASPDGSKSKAEVRILSLWPESKPEPILAINLVRLSKGKLIGVKYNKDFDWVGGTLGFFEI